MIKTSAIRNIFVTTLAALCLSACSLSAKDVTIPTENSISINEAAETLGITVDDFELFLTNLDTSYDDYMKQLSASKQSLSNVKTNIEKTYNCTFKNYIDTVDAINNETTPSSDDYVAYKSKYSVYDAYFPKTELNVTENTLKTAKAAIHVADDAENVVAFDMMQLCSGDFRLYFDRMIDKYKCDSVEISNFTMLGGYGVTKPAETNPCMDAFFVYGDETGEILDKFSLSMLTLCYKDENKNISLALSNEMGLLFQTTGAESRENMLKLKDLSFQVRRASH